MTVPLFRAAPLRGGLMLALLGLASPVTLLAADAPSPAQIKRAADEFDQGIKAAKGGDFDAAAGHFEGADRAAPSPDALRAAIRARRDARQADRAATLAEWALSRYPDQKELSAYARGILGQFIKDLYRVTVTCEPTCAIAVDQRMVFPEVVGAMGIYLEPGQHQVSAAWGDKSAARDVVARYGASTSLSFSMPQAGVAVASELPPPASSSTGPSSSATAGEEPPRKGLSPAFFVTGAALTVVLGALSAASGLDAQKNPGTEQVKQACVGLGPGCPAYQDGLSRQRRTNVLLGATASLGAVTAVIGVFFTNWAGKSGAGGGTNPASASVSVQPILGFGGGGASIAAAGRF